MNITYLSQGPATQEDESRWFHQCSRKNIPMIKTCTRTALGDVDWDCITISPRDDDFLYSQEDFIVQELNDLLTYYETPKVINNIGAYCGSVKNLPVEYVEDFAQDVCNTLSEAYKRHSRQRHLTKI
jgi:hypothetical protein